MTDDTTPTEPAAAAEPAPAPAAAPTQLATRRRGAGWWVLVSAAGAGLLVVGLLGGILIGQHTRGPGIGDRAGFDRSTSQGDHSGDQRTPREHMQDGQSGGQGNNG